MIPATSLTLPLLGRYLLFSMVWIAIAVLLTTMVINLHYRQPSTHKVWAINRRLFQKFALWKIDYYHNSSTFDEILEKLKATWVSSFGGMLDFDSSSDDWFESQPGDFAFLPSFKFAWMFKNLCGKIISVPLVPDMAFAMSGLALKLIYSAFQKNSFFGPFIKQNGAASNWN